MANEGEAIRPQSAAFQPQATKMQLSDACETYLPDRGDTYMLLYSPYMKGVPRMQLLAAAMGLILEYRRINIGAAQTISGTQRMRDTKADKVDRTIRDNIGRLMKTRLIKERRVTESIIHLKRASDHAFTTLY